MACLGHDNVFQQKMRPETTLYHTNERTIAWIVLAILAISRLILAVQFDEDDPYNRIGENLDAIEASLVRRCSYELDEQCIPLPMEMPPSGPTDKVRLEVQERAGCHVILASQPFLVALSKAGQIYQSVDCRGPPPDSSDTGVLKEEDQLFVNNPLNDEEEQLLDSFIEMTLKLLLQSNVTEAWRERYRHVYVDSWLELMASSQVERLSTGIEPAGKKFKAKLYLSDKLLPTGRLDRTELQRRLMDSWDKIRVANNQYHTEELHWPSSNLESTPVPLPTPLFHHNVHYEYPEKATAACIRHLHNQNRLLTRGACSVFLPLAQAKARELEVRWDYPFAALLLWIYIILCGLALLILSCDVGQGETKQQRWRRQFRNVLQDPLLRKILERDAMKKFNGDAQEVVRFMAEQDARAAQFEAADADLDWKRSEALLETWKQRVHFVWVVRKALAVAFILSCWLLIIDMPKAGVVLDGAMVIVLTFGITYSCLPQSPTQQSKKDTKSDLEEALLRPET